MKKLIFDHTQTHVSDALKVDTGTHAKKIVACIKEFAESDSTKISSLAELMHNNLDYNSILLLAVENVMDKVHSSEQSPSIKELKALLDLLS